MLDILSLIYNIFGDLINMLDDIKIYNDISLLSLFVIVSLFSLAILFLRRD